MRAKLFLLRLYNRRRFIKLQYVYKIINNINCPKQLTGYLVKRSQRRRRSVRDAILLDPPLVKTKCGQTSFNFWAVSAWNKLPREIRELRTLAQFKVRTFTLYFMNMDRANHICNVISMLSSFCYISVIICKPLSFMVTFYIFFCAGHRLIPVYQPCWLTDSSFTRINKVVIIIIIIIIIMITLLAHVNQRNSR